MLYYVMCDAASRALDVLPDIPENRAARELLEKALLEAEELYIETAEDALLAGSMDEFARQEGERYQRLNERLQNDPAAAVPEELTQRGLDVIDKILREREGK